MLEAWAGLGYYSRARNLHETARRLAAEGFPNTEDGWRALPGVVPYTAAAIAAIAYGQPANAVDEKVRRKPYSVVLLDEIEKAHPDVFNILLQVFDDGILTDSLGRRVDFKNTIIIMTSNIGTRELKKSGGFGFGTETAKHSADSIKSTIEDALKRVFNPEFLNRIDDTIIFGSLSKEHIMQIVDIQMRDLMKRVSSMGISVELTKSAKEFLADKGYDPSYGARPLRRGLQKYLEDP